MVASTNHLDDLDAGLSSRPSRFDRKYLFPIPSEDERDLYCQYWREKLKAKKVEVEFPKKICPALALITDGFSFAYMQEAFVATLLAIALRRSETVDEEMELVDGGGDDSPGASDKDLNDYELWRELKKTVKLLRDDMDNTPEKSRTANDPFEEAFAMEKEAQAPTAASEPRLLGQATVPPQPAANGSGRTHKPLHVRGMAVEVDYQNVPIIADEKFCLSLNEVE